MKSISPRIRDVRASSDRGVSLVELLVTLVVGAIVLSLVGGFFVQSTRVTSSSNQSRVTTGMVVNAENKLTNVVRVITQAPLSDGTTPFIVSATPNSFQFYSYGTTAAADMRISKFTIERISDRIRVTQCIGTFSGSSWSFPCAPANSSVVTYPGVVVDAVSTNSELPLFTYYDALRAPLGVGQAALTTTQISQVAAVAVSVKLKTTATTPSASAVYITNTVGLPNIALVQPGDNS